jgi:hypothetical protein
MRRGLWLGYQEGPEWTAIAKFRSEAAADKFLSVLRTMARRREVFQFGGGE